MYHRIKGTNTPMGCTKAGRAKRLSSDIEHVLEKCLKDRAEMGYPCDNEELKSLVGDYVRNNNLVTLFKDIPSGDDWYYAFMRRHPRKPEIIYDFYEKLKQVVVKYHLHNCTAFIFNADESGKSFFKYLTISFFLQ